MRRMRDWAAALGGLALACAAALGAGTTSAAAQAPDGVERSRALDVLDRRLAHYVMRERTPAIRARLAAGRDGYLAAATDAAFVEAVNADLLATSHDRHLAIWREDRSRDAAPDPSARTAVEAERADGFGVRRAEVLEGGVAYLDLAYFSGSPEGAQAIDAAMERLRGTRALILDLRENGGGNDRAYRRLMGHLTPEPVVLGEIHMRRCAPDPADPEGCVQDGSRDVEVMVADAVARPAFPTQPILVLTSRRTFSAAEAVAFDLRVEGRGVVIGETTGGGGNISAAMDLGPWFTVVMPIGEGRHPKAATGWEGVGVTPDVPVVAERALETARALAGR